MSFLTDVAVVTIGGEDEAVAFVNARLAEGDPRPQQLGRTDLEQAGAGGRKVSSVVVYAACFNYLDLGGFEDAVRTAPWRLPGWTRTAAAACRSSRSAGRTPSSSTSRAAAWWTPT